MLKIEEIREIIELIDKSSIDKFSYEVDGAKIKLAKNKENSNIVVSEETVRTVAPQTASAPVAQVVEAPQQQPAEQEPAAPSALAVQDANVYEVTSPMVGTFYEASSPEADPFVKVGQKVQEDTVVCIVEAMKLFNEIEAEVSGEIVDILVQDGQLVEFGQPLFLVKRN